MHVGETENTRYIGVHGISEVLTSWGQGFQLYLDTFIYLVELHRDAIFKFNSQSLLYTVTIIAANSNNN